jgi:replication fork clamp-binding protein CrfC
LKNKQQQAQIPGATPISKFGVRNSVFDISADLKLIVSLKARRSVLNTKMNLVESMETPAKQNVLKNTRKRTRQTAISCIFVPKRSFHGTPGQIY